MDDLESTVTGPKPQPAPLAGLRVLDLSRALAGPFCAMLLGDLGADVIKVENPHLGDETRAWGPPSAGGESGYYLSANRNKRSVTINIRAPEGADLVRRLATHSDILIENFAPGVPAKYGFDFATLHTLHPGLIYCDISSFDPGSAYDGIPGYDFVIQAMSGLMSITGEPDGPPQKVGVAVVDVLTGLFAGNAILAALHERDRTGRGQKVGVALLDSALASLVNVASNYLITGTRPRRWGNAHANLVPYQTLHACDGLLAVGVGNDGQFDRLVQTVGRPELAADERFRGNPARVRNREILIPLLEEALQAQTVTEWVRRLAEAKVPAAPVNHVDEMFQDPYVEEAGMVRRVPHPTAEEVPLVASPLRFGDIRPPIDRAPPTLGQHTAEVLCELLDLDENAVMALRASGAI